MALKSAVFAAMCCACLLSSEAYSQDTPQQGDSAAARLPVNAIGTEFHNSITLLNNRFRVDDDVEEVTMVFFRIKGGAPVVLVRPDGSKLFLEDARSNDKLKWFDAETYDMITLKQPMPGPWQAVGQILPQSKVMVIADIQLTASTIPTPVYAGEVLKQTARLENNGMDVDFSPFKDVVKLNIDFVSNNNPNYENFGAGTRRIAQFEDNGTDYDETRNDGTFTGEFFLNIPTGEWLPVFSVVTPMYTREQIGEVINLLPTPILFDVEISEGDTGTHMLSIDVDRQQLDMSTLVFSGTVRMPDGEEKDIAYTNVGLEAKKIAVDFDDYGLFKVNITAFARNTVGRDVVIEVPQFEFETIAPPPPPEPEYLLDEEGNRVLDDEGNPIIVEPPPVESVLDESLTMDKASQTSVDGNDALDAANTQNNPDDSELTLDASASDAMLEGQDDQDDSIVMTVIMFNAGLLVFGGLALVLIANVRKHPDSHIFKKLAGGVKSLSGKIKLPKKGQDTNKAKTEGEGSDAELKL